MRPKPTQPCVIAFFVADVNISFERFDALFILFRRWCSSHPYLSLQYLDLMTDVNVRGFVIGATNFLFRQKRHLTDIVIEVRVH